VEPERILRILSFTGGAGNMYCGSCLRDNALAAALIARGHDLVLSPVYTPTRTDEPNVSADQVFFGGISVFLEQHLPVFRHTPRALDRLWDSSWALRLASKRQIKVDAKSLGELTVSMLKGEQGFQAKEIGKLLDWLRNEPPFDLIVIPYSLLLGLAEPLKRELKAPVGCTLQGDDLFLDGLGPSYKEQSLELIRAASRYVDAFFPVSEYYRDFMPGYLGISRERMFVIPIAINLEGYAPRQGRRDRDFTVGYFARIAPEKGLHALCDAYVRLRSTSAGSTARLAAAGYMPPEHQGYLQEARTILRKAGLEDEFDYRGEVDRAEKIRFLRSVDVLSVPTVYEEPKGMFLLEAMACGVPVIQPRRGAFPEIVAKTKGGLIVNPDDPGALADALLALWRDPEKAAELGQAGATGVRQHYSVEVVAQIAEDVYASVATRSLNRRVS
jgi:glycosyltransferase involved in cell wall biosynthesis